MRSVSPRVGRPSLGELDDAGPDAALDPDGTDGLRIEGAVLDGVTRHDVTYRETVFVRAGAGETELTHCRFLDVVFDGLSAPDLTAARSTWRDVEITGSRVGTLGLYDATVSGMRIEHSKLNHLGLPGAQVNDLVVEHCAIEELDLTEASVTRMAVRDSTIGLLRVRGATLRHVDLRGAALTAVDPVEGLRGAVVSQGQLLVLAGDLAAALGIVVD